MPPLNLNTTEANLKLIDAQEQLISIETKLKGKVITDVTKQDAEEIWNLRGLLWEVAHYVDSRSGKLSSQSKTNQERNTKRPSNIDPA